MCRFFVALALASVVVASVSPDDLLTTPEAASYLNVTDRWMRRAVADRRVPFVKVGRLLRFRRKALDEFIAANTVEAIS